MHYDLDRVYNRKNTNRLKWDFMKPILGRDDLIPLWVADMDFPVAEPIKEAIKKRAEHPFYGYTQPGTDVVISIADRLKKKYDWNIEPEWVVFTPGVVPALQTAVTALTHPGDEVLLQQPAYHPFFSSGKK